MRPAWGWRQRRIRVCMRPWRHAQKRPRATARDAADWRRIRPRRRPRRGSEAPRRAQKCRGGDTRAHKPARARAGARGDAARGRASHRGGTRKTRRVCQTWHRAHRPRPVKTHARPAQATQSQIFRPCPSMGVASRATASDPWAVGAACRAQLSCRARSPARVRTPSRVTTSPQSPAPAAAPACAARTRAAQYAKLAAGVCCRAQAPLCTPTSTRHRP